jgi:hypothetical protein
MLPRVETRAIILPPLWGLILGTNLHDTIHFLVHFDDRDNIRDIAPQLIPVVLVKAKAELFVR